MAWVIVFVPIIVVLCSLAFGGAAVAAALAVRGGVRLARPNTPKVVQRVSVALLTGCCPAAVVIRFFAPLDHSWAVSDAAYGYSAVIGSVAAFASATYAHKVFEEPARAPEHDVV